MSVKGVCGNIEEEESSEDWREGEHCHEPEEEAQGWATEASRDISGTGRGKEAVRCRTFRVVSSPEGK